MLLALAWKLGLAAGELELRLSLKRAEHPSEHSVFPASVPAARGLARIVGVCCVAPRYRR